MVVDIEVHGVLTPLVDSGHSMVHELPGRTLESDVDLDVLEVEVGAPD